jgi:hypothetical protein
VSTVEISESVVLTGRLDALHQRVNVPQLLGVRREHFAPGHVQAVVEGSQYALQRIHPHDGRFGGGVVGLGFATGQQQHPRQWEQQPGPPGF